MNLRNALPIFFIFLALAADPPIPDTLPVLVLPPRPEVIPKNTELDPVTGLHVTGTPQFIKLATWRLRVTGKVTHPLTLTYDELRKMPRLSSRDPLICRGNFEDHAYWAGADMNAVLDRAKVSPKAKVLELISADGYSTEVSLAEARNGHAFLAYQWEDKALPELHGYPLRAVFPSHSGYDWAKWLVELRVH
jgi:DMSO/TMAO reductase YedYZ molybdopterin-dependent catalytic subunit